MFAQTAANKTYNTLASNRTVLTRSGFVYGIILANDTASPVTITLTDTATSPATEMIVQVPANDTFTCEVTWLAAKGLIVNSVSADVHMTIFHSNPAGSM